MLPPLVGAVDPPTRTTPDNHVDHVAGAVRAVSLTVALAVTGAVLYQLAGTVTGAAHHAVASMPEGLSPAEAPEVGLPDAGELPLGRPVPVRTGPFAPADLRCRAWTDDTVSIPEAHRYPVVAGPDGGARCTVILSPTEMAPGRSFTVQPVRVDRSGSVVGEYRPVVLRWSHPEPGSD